MNDVMNDFDKCNKPSFGSRPCRSDREKIHKSESLAWICHAVERLTSNLKCGDNLQNLFVYRWKCLGVEQSHQTVAVEKEYWATLGSSGGSTGLGFSLSSIVLPVVRRSRFGHNYRQNRLLWLGCSLGEWFGKYRPFPGYFETERLPQHEPVVWLGMPVGSPVVRDWRGKCEA